MFRPFKSSPWAVLVIAAAAAGCSREDVTHTRVAKPQAPAPGAPVAPGMHEMPATVPAVSELPPLPSRPGGLKWTLPQGWTESAGGQMRYATLRAPVAGRIDASVVVLPGPAGGELANVNRWRNQIGLPPLDAAGLAKVRTAVRTKAGIINVYDFTSEGPTPTRVVAGLTESKGDTWFVKITGDAAAVSAARADFMKLLGSLRFE